MSVCACALPLPCRPCERVELARQCERVLSWRINVGAHAACPSVAQFPAETAVPAGALGQRAALSALDVLVADMNCALSASAPPSDEAASCSTKGRCDDSEDRAETRGRRRCRAPVQPRSLTRATNVGSKTFSLGYQQKGINKDACGTGPVDLRERSAIRDAEDGTRRTSGYPACTKVILPHASNAWSESIATSSSQTNNQAGPHAGHAVFVMPPLPFALG